MKQLKIENLRTIKNYAMQNSITPSYVYKLVKEDKMKAVIIDGVQFIDILIYPVIPKGK